VLGIGKGAKVKRILESRGMELTTLAQSMGTVRKPAQLGGAYAMDDGMLRSFSESDAELRCRLIGILFGVEPVAPYMHRGDP
jgi:hypothetical protein